MRKSLLPAGCIVVGVDGSEQAERAIAWAAEQAVLEGRTLALVHTADQLVLRETASLDRAGIDHRQLTQALSSAARATLASARDRAELAAPDVTVITELLDIDARDALVDLSEDAHLIVLGSRGRGPLRTALLGSVSASVARRAHCPVVVCRPAEPKTPASSGVTVGADGREGSQPVLEFAFAQASLRAVPLTVTSAFPAAGGDVDLTLVRLLLAESVGGLAEKYPDVTVTQDLSRGLVDECLADHTPNAEMLVVGRASAVGWPRFLHTSCALAVLERARTTVAVVPETEER
jgi:nucleotide-binding universal stress UspA family protein